LRQKYLTGEKVRTLDDYAKEHGVKFKRHAVFVSGNAKNPDEFDISGEDKSSLRKGLAYSIALSSIVGDHDINPGNIMIVDEKVARIDFGHAFNDLISAFSIFGGGFGNSSNRILDFINRERVAGFPPPGDKSKLWRDYPGLIPYEEIAQVYDELSKPDNTINIGINKAKDEFKDLLRHVRTKPNTNEREVYNVTNHVINSLYAINKNIGGKKVKAGSKDPDKFIDEVFANVAEFCLENKSQMQSVSKLLKLQNSIDKILQQAAKEGKEPTIEQCRMIRTQYNELKKQEGIGKRGWFSVGIRWAKCEKNSYAYEGSLRGYIKHRSKQLGIGYKIARDFANKAKYAKPEKETELPPKELMIEGKKREEKLQKASTVLAQSNLPRKSVEKSKILKR
jgi:hypothetical protein